MVVILFHCEIFFRFCLEANVPAVVTIDEKPWIEAYQTDDGKTELQCLFKYNSFPKGKSQFHVSWFRPVQFYGGKFGKISMFSEVVSDSPSKYIVTLGQELSLGGEVS